MPRYFFDSSAILKRYYQEPGSAWVRAMCKAHIRPLLYLSQVAQVEVVAALRRIGRTNDEHLAYIDTLVALFARHMAHGDYEVVPLSHAVTTLAAWLCSKYWDVNPGPLRSLDAIELASASAAASVTADGVLFVTADTRLAAIAALEGLRVVNPAYPPAP